MQFLVLKCVSTYTRGRLIHEYIRYLHVTGLFPSKIQPVMETVVTYSEKVMQAIAEKRISKYDCMFCKEVEYQGTLYKTA